MERRETTPVDEEPPRKIPRRECSDSSETMSQSLETTRGSSDTTLASVSDPENTRSSEKSISVQWGTEDTMVKILQAMKAGAGPGAGVTIDELLERGPVLPDGERRTAARCFNSLLTPHCWTSIKSSGSRPHAAAAAPCVMSRPCDVELLPLKSALVNNNRDEEAYYPGNPSSSNDYTLLSKRTPASKRLQPRTAAPASTPMVTLCGAPAPSRRREELATMANLRKKVAPALLLADKRSSRNNNEQANNEVNEVQLDNRPKLLQKVLRNKPVSMVVQWSEVRTAWQDSDFITECLCWHNVYRQRHGSPQLFMAPELCDYAQAWANHLAHTNRFYYRNDRDVGQNLYQRPVSALQPDVTGQEVSSYWYAAVRQYRFFKEPDILHANVNAGHFTQMVWMATRFFGVGKARSRAGKVIVVANYSPPGNFSGQFDSNVLPPLPENFQDLPFPPLPEH